MWIGGIRVVKARSLVMVVQESHKKITGVPMCTENIVLYLLTQLKQVDNFTWSKQAFTRAWEFIKQWEIERSIDTDGIARFRVEGITANEASNGLFFVIHFAESEKV